MPPTRATEINGKIFLLQRSNTSTIVIIFDFRSIRSGLSLRSFPTCTLCLVRNSLESMLNIPFDCEIVLFLFTFETFIWTISRFNKIRRGKIKGTVYYDSSYIRENNNFPWNYIFKRIYPYVIRDIMSIISCINCTYCIITIGNWSTYFIKNGNNNFNIDKHRERWKNKRRIRIVIGN